MTSIKPVLNSRPDKQGRHTLVLQIIHNRHRGVIFSPYHLLPGEFDAARSKAIALSRTKEARLYAVRVNEFITMQTSELQLVIGGLQLSGNAFTTKDIIEAYRLRSEQHYIRIFILSLCKDLDQGGKHGTSGNYRAMLSAFEKFAGHTNISLRELTPSLLAKFEQHLNSGRLEQNTVTFYMRIFRAIYNKARRMGLVEKMGNPFEEVSFRIDKTRKRAVSFKTMQRVVQADLKNNTWLEQARDLFLFSFYARGMSFVDMAYLQQNAIQGDMLFYTRRKTGQMFSVRIIPPLRELINRYAHCSPWVLPVMKFFPQEQNGLPSINLKANAHNEVLYKRYKEALTLYWYYLGVISQELCTEKRLSFNVARHTWASMARNKGVSMAVISKALGHTSEKTTSIYIDDLDAREVDSANEVVSSL